MFSEQVEGILSFNSFHCQNYATLHITSSTHFQGNLEESWEWSGRRPWGNSYFNFTGWQTVNNCWGRLNMKTEHLRKGKKIFFLIYLDISLATQARKIKCKKHKTGFYWEICWSWLCCLHWNTQESPFISKHLNSTNHLLDKRGNLILWEREGADLKGSSTCVCATVSLFK